MITTSQQNWQTELWKDIHTIMDEFSKSLEKKLTLPNLKLSYEEKTIWCAYKTKKWILKHIPYSMPKSSIDRILKEENPTKIFCIAHSILTQIAVEKEYSTMFFSDKAAEDLQAKRRYLEHWLDQTSCQE